MTQFLRQACLKRDDVPSFDRYPFALPAVRHLETLDFHPRVTFFIGENGSGKSTLLEVIAVAFGFNPEGGRGHGVNPSNKSPPACVSGSIWTLPPS